MKLWRYEEALERRRAPLVTPISTMPRLAGVAEGTVDRVTQTFNCMMIGQSPVAPQHAKAIEAAELARERVRRWYVAATREAAAASSSNTETREEVARGPRGSRVFAKRFYGSVRAARRRMREMPIQMFGAPRLDKTAKDAARQAGRLTPLVRAGARRRDARVV